MILVGSHQLFLTARLSLDLGYEEQGLLLLEHLVGHLPSHLAGHCLLGHRYLVLERHAEAGEHFGYALSADPLHRSALKGMAQVELIRGVAAVESQSLRQLVELYPYDVEARELLGCSADGLSTLSLARVLTMCERHDEAVTYYEAACAQSPEDPEQEAIRRLLLAQALWMVGQVREAGSALKDLERGHPSWVRPKLLLADIALEDFEDALGVALFHDARALDTSGDVAGELLGANGRYASLLEHSFRLPSPPTDALEGAPHILTYLLRDEPAPEPQSGGHSGARAAPEESEQRRLQQKAKSGDTAAEAMRDGVVAPPLVKTGDVIADLPASQGHAAVRLVVSSRARTIARYGEEGYRELDTRLSELCEAITRSTGDETIKLHVDDESCVREFGLETVEASNPRAVAGLLRQLDRKLRSESRKVESLLIVGGDKIIPFHKLANPADDDDPGVASDWPYATEEDEPLLSRFAVGRLPDNEPADLDTFLGIVELAVTHHNTAAVAGNGVSLSSWRNPVRRLLSARNLAHSSVGYTAEIWAEASRSVYELIGDAARLQVSPPVTDYDFLTAHEKIPTLSYFNLHGFRGSPYWYGHGESEQGPPLLPVALTPLSVSWTKAQGTVVYSEACYGADLEREYPEGSIPLNFLSAGALGFVGSTSMSYGALEPPLCGADLLGMHLWEGVLGGLRLGDALRRARAAFMRTAAAQQGYLDGEDQKALLSFVLYGDPSLGLRSAQRAPEIDSEVEVACPPLACCSRMMDAEALPLPKEAREKVKRSLPFVQTNGFIAHPLILCRVACSGEGRGSHSCSAEQGDNGGVSQLLQASQQPVVSKGGEQLRHVVKVTVNADGEVLKVSVSRGGIRTGEGYGKA